jgi:hypothetical protein
MGASFRQNTADDPLEARPTTSVFGNERGLSFWDTIDELKARLDAETTSLRAEDAGLRSRLDMVEAYTDDFILVRQSLLEEWRTGDKSHRSRAIVYPRNEIAHGGHLRLDIEIIERDKQKKNSTTSLWIPGFEKVYGLKYSDAKTLAHSAPPDLIELINMRVHVTVLDVWNPTYDSATSHISEKRRSIQQAVQQIINVYLTTSPDKQPNLFRPGGELVKRYFDVRDLYRTVCGAV